MSVAMKDFELTQNANFEALRAVQPYLAEFLEQKAKDLGFASWTANYKGPYVELRDGEGKLRFVENVGLGYSCISGNPDCKSAIVLGLGLGNHFLNTFTEKDENLRIICCEPDPALLYWALCLHNFSHLISKSQRGSFFSSWEKIKPTGTANGARYPPGSGSWARLSLPYMYIGNIPETTFQR